MPRQGDIETSLLSNVDCAACGDPAKSLIAEWPLCNYCKKQVLTEFWRATVNRTKGFGNGQRKKFVHSLIKRV